MEPANPTTSGPVQAPRRERLPSLVRSAVLGMLGLSLLNACSPYPATGAFERTLSVSGAARLVVQNRSGTVRVRKGESGRVHVVGRVTVWALSPRRARERLRQVIADPPVAQTDGEVRLETPAWIRGRIDYTVEVPRGTDVQVATGSGDVEVLDVEGPVEARTGSGDVEVRSTQNVRVRTGSGDVRVREARGSVVVRTGSGDTVVQGAEGPVETTTGSGDILLIGVSDDLQGRTGSGDITVRSERLHPGRTWDLRTGSGDIEMTLPEGTRFAVTAATGAGRVESEFPLTTVRVQARRHLEGTVGTGGPDLRIEARAGSGSVRIHRGPAEGKGPGAESRP